MKILKQRLSSRYMELGYFSIYYLLVVSCRNFSLKKTKFSFVPQFQLISPILFFSSIPYGLPTSADS